MTDPIADMLGRIRNAVTAEHEEVEVPASKIKLEIARVLKQEGFIRGYELIDDGKQGILKIRLKYGPGKEKVIHGIKRISKPGRRTYVKRREIPRVMGGLGIAILSTSRGIMTDREARRLGIGGEVLCLVW